MLLLDCKKSKEMNVPASFNKNAEYFSMNFFSMDGSDVLLLLYSLTAFMRFTTKIQ